MRHVFLYSDHLENRRLMCPTQLSLCAWELRVDIYDPLLISPLLLNAINLTPTADASMTLSKRFIYRIFVFLQTHKGYILSM